MEPHTHQWEYDPSMRFHYCSIEDMWTGTRCNAKVTDQKISTLKWWPDDPTAWPWSKGIALDLALHDGRPLF